MRLADETGMHGHQIELETLKLLVQVAWADHEIARQEAEHILSLARQIDVTEDELQALQSALSDEGRLPAPNMGLLRQHYDHVMRSVDQLIAIDNQIVDDERSIRNALAHMLTAP